MCQPYQIVCFSSFFTYCAVNSFPFFSWWYLTNLDQSTVEFFFNFVQILFLIFSGALKLQDQVPATENKQFDPLGPLPHGWGKISLTTSHLTWKGHRWICFLDFWMNWWFYCSVSSHLHSQRKELTATGECTLFNTPHGLHSGRTLALRGEKFICATLSVDMYSNIYF